MNELIFFGIIIFIGLIIIIVRGSREQKRQKELVLRRIRGEFGTVPMEHPGRLQAAVKGSYLHFIEKNNDFFLDDITWSDLDLDQVFRRINYTRSSAGAEELYRMIRCPEMDEIVLEERDTLIEGMEQSEALRERLSMELHQIGFTGKYALADYLDYLGTLGDRNNRKHILMDLLYIPAIGLLFVQTALGIIALFLVLILNIMTYFKEKGEINPYLVSFGYILRMLSGAERMADVLGKAKGHNSGNSNIEKCFAKYQDMLENKVKALESFRRFSGIAMSMGNSAGGSGPLDLLLDYIKMAFHFDLMKFNQMLKVVRSGQEVIEEMAGIVGTLDACISIAYYRASLDSWCKPDWQEHNAGTEDDADKKSQRDFGAGRIKKGSYGIITEEIYHPLLEAPVKNSITAEKGVLVTGSNASGKSTFLKTIAIGAVLSQTICTVSAKSWSAPFFRVMSSMALRDNLTGGESYFMVEIKVLKRILDACQTEMEIKDDNLGKADKRSDKNSPKSQQKQPPVLCFVDEVLRGTNTVERIAASSRILKSLIGKEVLCFAATHDIELTHLLEMEYENYHFEETIEHGDISFNYLLKKGRAESRNAIRLLEVMGYDKAVTKEAEQLAKHFLETGKWESQ